MYWAGAGLVLGWAGLVLGWAEAGVVVLMLF